MKITLIHPPLDDPTIPYHSTAYLTGHLHQNGFRQVSMRDLNIEFVTYCLEEDVIHQFYNEADRRLTRLSQSHILSFQDQEQYYALSATPRFSTGALRHTALSFKKKELFLDYEEYVRNVKRLTGYFSMLGSLSYPLEFDGFTSKTRGRLSFYNLTDLLSSDLGETVCYPLERFFAERLSTDSDLANTDLFGISIVYDHQLFHALHLARLIRRRWPQKRVVLGGTAISQLYKYMKDKAQMKRFFSLCDAIVVGEGETAICQIANCAGELHEVSDLRNTITYDQHQDRLHFPRVEYEIVGALGAPIYQHPWDLYLSPERGINYSPTRGCYWNRCTFCDYGLNTDKPTSPWRERRIDQVVEDISAAQRNFGVKYVYLAVDVMAPGYLERLSDAMIDAKMEISWSGEIRLEKIFSPERCRKMAQSGCVCVSFGMESGSQRILDLIDKGTRVDFMAQTMKNFASAEIAVQLMAFKDFPTETEAERTATYQFVKDNAEHWSAGGIGTFLLTGTSMIARNPKQFGITILDTQGADVARAVAYRVDSENDYKVNLTEEADSSFDETGACFPSVLGRPWAGGTDTLHSMIYYRSFGKSFFKQHSLPGKKAGHVIVPDKLLESVVQVTGALTESTLDLPQIFNNRMRFAEYVRGRLAIPAEPTYESFLEWSASLPALPPRERSGITYWLASPQEGVKLDAIVYKLLFVATKQCLTFRQMTLGFTLDVRQKLLTYFTDLENRGLLAFVSANVAEHSSRETVAC